jgi:spermidine synthase
MILRDILPKPEVTSVTVVEINPDVAALMEPIIRKWPGGEKLTVVCKDIFKWKPAKGQLFDVVWFDIWADQTTDDRKDITRLHRRAAWWCRPGAWVASWQVNTRPRVSGTAS